jgi:phytoene desaturase
VSRVVVIGAGVSGLAVAARLARLRHAVTVVEQSDTVGGRVAVLDVDGFRFQTGPTSLLLPAAVRDLFIKTGKPLESVLELTPAGPTAVDYADGPRFVLPNAGTDAVADAMQDALGGAAGADWRRLMDRAGRMWDLTRTRYVEPAYDVSGVSARPSRRDLLALQPWRSLRGVARAGVRDEWQRHWLEHYAVAMALDPRRAPAALAVVPYVEQTFLRWQVTGGMAALIRAIHERAVALRVSIVGPVAAEAVETGDDGVRGVRLGDGRTLPADVVVSSVDPARLLEAAPARQTDVRPVSEFQLALGLRGRDDAGPGRRVLFGALSGDQLEAVWSGPPRPPANPTLTIDVSHDDVPDGHEGWLVRAPVTGQGPVDWSAPGFADRYAERVLTVLANLGYDVRDRIVTRRHHSPADIAHETAAPGGASYGPGWGRRGALTAPNRTPVPGLFRVGDTARPGGGLPLVLLSAAAVAEQIGRA